MNINKIGLQARDAAIKGMGYVAGVVKSTIGPYGSNVLIEKENRITNDGYLISCALSPAIRDEFERRGALVALEASSKTNDTVGDATSTAWALTEAIVKEAIRYLPSEKIIKAQKTPAEIIQMINSSRDRVIKELEDSATPVKSKEELIKSALVAVEDEGVAKILGETQWELGPEGLIIAEEVNETKSSIERVKGIRVDNGFGTSMVITNQEKQSLELNEISVLMTNYTIDVSELKLLNDSVFKPLINQKKMGLVIIARAYTSEAIKACMESLKTGFAIFPVNAPYTDQHEILKDMEAVLGGRYIDSEEARLEDIDISDIGFAKRFMARRFDAIIAGEDNEKTKERSDARVEVLKKKLIGSQSDFEKKSIEVRIAQLTNGFALLKVGSQSLANRKRLKDKCDDATNAVRLALKHGTVKGGGLAFKEISDKLEDGNILKRPLLCVYEQIINSAPEGFIIPEWVRDPLQVLKVALVNACDVAGVFSSVSGIVVEENIKKCSCQTNED
jgi:chaperonin GroEL